MKVAPEQINLGQVVRETENDLGVVACLRKEAQFCAITPACKLKAVLAEATERFLNTLEEYSLADVIENRGQLSRLLGVRLAQLGTAKVG